MEVILDALKDTLIVFPFILIIYILIELTERGTTAQKTRRTLQGPLAPVIGSATGLVPQCGFSVMAAKLYDRGLIRTGTLLAVFIACSDEALIIMLSDLSAAGAVMPLILIKLCIAVGMGYLVNFILSNEKVAEMGLMADSQAHYCCDEHAEKSDLQVYLISPLLHSLKIALYLLLINLLFGFIVEAVGEENISAAMMGGAYVQPLITALIGLIPNCASSVILTGAYINGGILFGSFVGGLCSNAGLGLVVLMKNTKKLKRNILLVVSMYVIAVVAGIAVNGFMILLKMI